MSLWTYLTAAEAATVAGDVSADASIDATAVDASVAVVKVTPDVAETLVGVRSEDIAKSIEAQAPGWLREHSFYMANWQWLGLLILIVLGVVAGRSLRYMIDIWLDHWNKRREKKDRQPIDQRIIDKADIPFQFLGTSLLLMIGYPILNLPETFAWFLGAATMIGATFSGVWTIYVVSDIASDLAMQLAAKTENKLDDLLVPLIRRTVKVVITVFGIIFVAQNLNVNVTGLLAGLSLCGLAFSFAAKDTVANFFGSITILLDQPFTIGDWVVIDGAEGIVEDVGFRTTRIRTFYNSVIVLPNSTITTTKVDNYGMRQYRRCSCMLGVTYDTPPEKIEAFCEGIRELIRLHPYTRKDYFNVYFNAYNNCSLDILLYVFWKVPNWQTELREKQRIFIDIKRLAARMGIGFAFPTQTLHIESMPGLPAGALPAPATPPSAPAPAESPEPCPLKPLAEPGDYEAAHDWGRTIARELVYAALGNPAMVPPPAT